jgi:integrase
MPMRVRRREDDDGRAGFELVDDVGPVEVVSAFLDHLASRGCSPNTVSAYAHDLLHLWRFLSERRLSWDEFTPVHALSLLEHLRTVTSSGAAQRLGLGVVYADATGSAMRLAPATVNRALSAVSSFYEFAIVSGRLVDGDNPVERRLDPALARVSDRRRPALGRSSRQRPMRRSVRVKTVQRLPRPLSDEQVEALIARLCCERDRALVLMMLEGGLRPGETLGLHLDDIDYGRRRVVVRHREDHPRGVRSKSRTERVVDLHEGAALAALSAYVMGERPREADTPLVFLVGGNTRRRCEPLGYPALARLFARAATRAGIRAPWVTPHALRHTHATRMWERGMRELTLQRRLGHASPESTRIYTRVCDAEVLADYRRALGERDT